MKAIQIHEFGEAEVLRYEELPEPWPKEGEVLVEVRAAGVNYADILTRRGKYSQKPLPFVPGFEAAGVILETGRGVQDWKPGQRVMGTVLRDTSGCYAQKAVMPGWLLLPVPEQFSFEQAASFSEVFVTAHLALHVNGRLAKGESVLIHAAGGGVGTAAVQMARAMGARVFATASSEEKLRKVKQMGADVLINYSSLDFLEEVKKHTDGKGVDVVLESVGGEVFDKSLKCLRPLGRLVAYGTSSAKSAAARVPDLMAGAISVAGFSYGFLSVARPDVIQQAMRAVMELLSQGKIRPVLGHTFPLEQARAAHELISSRASFGKVVLVP